jgi:hypothetical protein
LTHAGLSIRGAIRDWEDAWRHTEVWRELFVDGDDKVLAQALLNDLGCPRNPQDGLQELFAVGAFDAIEQLLALQHFRDEAGQHDWDSEVSRLAMVREQARWDVELNRSELERRAHAVFQTLPESDAAVAEAVRWSTRDRRRALDALRDVELGIARAEEVRLSDMRKDFEARRSEFDEHRCRAIERGIEARDIALVSSLLAGDAEERLFTQRPIPPRPRPGPYGDRDPAVLCRWILDGSGGPVDFYAQWNPADDGTHALIDCMHDLRTAPKLDQSKVAKLALEFCRLLGGVDQQPAVRIQGEWAWGRLGKLIDPACPGIASFNFRLVMSAALGDADSTLDACTEDGVINVVLTAKSQDVVAVRAVNLTPWDVIRFLRAPQDFKTNFLRHVCEQLPLQMLISHEDWLSGVWLDQFPAQEIRSDQFVGATFSELRFAAERVMDISGQRCEGRALDRLACYCAGRPALLGGLLRSLFADLEERATPRQAVVAAREVQLAFQTARYEAMVNLVVFTRLEDHPVDMLVLAATIVSAEPNSAYGRIALVDDILMWTGAEDFGPSVQVATESVENLAKLGFIEPVDERKVRLVNRTGVFALFHKLEHSAADSFYERAKKNYLQSQLAKH